MNEAAVRMNEVWKKVHELKNDLADSDAELADAEFRARTVDALRAELAVATKKNQQVHAHTPLAKNTRLRGTLSVLV